MWEESVEADGLSVVEEEGLSLLEVEEVCEDGVVADFGMEVEGEVHGVEGEAMGVEGGEAPCHEAVEALESAAPTDAVVDEEEVGVLGDGLVDGLLAGVDGEGDSLDVGGGLDLESVVGVVLVCETVEESAEKGCEFVQFHGVGLVKGDVEWGVGAVCEGGSDLFGEAVVAMMSCGGEELGELVDGDDAWEVGSGLEEFAGGAGGGRERGGES